MTNPEKEFRGSGFLDDWELGSLDRNGAFHALAAAFCTRQSITLPRILSLA